MPAGPELERIGLDLNDREAYAAALRDALALAAAARGGLETLGDELVVQVNALLAGLNAGDVDSVREIGARLGYRLSQDARVIGSMLFALEQATGRSFADLLAVVERDLENLGSPH